MKLLLLLNLTTLFCMQNHCEGLISKTSQSNPTASQSLEDDDVDAQVVLSNITQMLQSIGTISTDPKNPMVVGPHIASMATSFCNIVVQMFKEFPFTTELDAPTSRSYVEKYSNDASPQEKELLARLLVEYSKLSKKISSRSSIKK